MEKNNSVPGEYGVSFATCMMILFDCNNYVGGKGAGAAADFLLLGIILIRSFFFFVLIACFHGWMLL